MSGKSQTIGDFTFCRPSQIYQIKPVFLMSGKSQTIGDIFDSRQNLGESGNSKIPDRLGFSRHMKTRL